VAGFEQRPHVTGVKLLAVRNRECPRDESQIEVDLVALSENIDPIDVADLLASALAS
jgi:hypothetical protein